MGLLEYRPVAHVVLKATKEPSRPTKPSWFPEAVDARALWFRSMPSKRRPGGTSVRQLVKEDGFSGISYDSSLDEMPNWQGLDIRTTEH